MRRNLSDMLPNEIVNMVKRDSNEMEARVGIDLIKLVEMGIVNVVGIADDKLLYQRACEEN